MRKFLLLGWFFITTAGAWEHTTVTYSPVFSSPSLCEVARLSAADENPWVKVSDRCFRNG